MKEELDPKFDYFAPGIFENPAVSMQGFDSKNRNRIKNRNKQK
jgi:hypothetical protein